MFYKLKITLTGIRPPIWRRVILPDNATLDDLHSIIRVCFGWDGSHCHAFRINGRVHGPFSTFGYDDRKTDADPYIELRELICRPKTKFHYRYDFGDEWLHEIILEAVVPENTAPCVVACLKGARACPPDDTGGIYRYAYLIECLKRKEGEEYIEARDWLGEDFDPEAFDLDGINKCLAHACRNWVP